MGVDGVYHQYLKTLFYNLVSHPLLGNSGRKLEKALFVLYSSGSSGRKLEKALFCIVVGRPRYGARRIFSKTSCGRPCSEV